LRSRRNLLAGVFLVLVIVRVAGESHAGARPASAAAADAHTPSSVLAISCATARTCTAIAVRHDNQPGAFSLRTSDGGRRWTSTPIKGDEISQIQAVACPSTSVCFAGGYGPPSETRGVVTTDDGLTWSVLPWPTERVGLPIDAIACRTSEACVAAGHAFLVTTDGGLNWVSHPVPGIALIDGVSCPGVMTCYAFGGAGGHASYFYTTTDAGATWSAQRVDTTFEGIAQALTCPSASTCYAVEPGGVLVTHDAGKHWSDWREPPPTGDGLFALACWSDRNCETGGDNDGGIPGGVPLHAYFFGTTNGGRTWTRQAAPLDLGQVFAITCPRSRDCIAVGNAGRRLNAAAAITTDGGHSWVEERMP
jgi:photosystem II stability/assembly factor-like uncharacterized protein